MNTPRTPPRFVPTLTDVVPAPPGLPPLAPPPPPPPLPEAPPAPAPLPITLVDEAPSPAGDFDRGAAPDAVTLAVADADEEPLVRRLRELIEQRLQQALQAALHDLEPLLHEALAQALAQESGRLRALPDEGERAAR